MNIISAHGPQHTGTGGIDLVVTFDGVNGEIPFHAHPSDTEKHGRELYTRALSGEFGPVLPYVAPPTPVPQSVTKRQARLALLGAGLLDDVEAAIENITDPMQKRVAQIDWETADSVERSWPMLVQLAKGMLGMTDQQLDELFIAAATL